MRSLYTFAAAAAITVAAADARAQSREVVLFPGLEPRAAATQPAPVAVAAVGKTLSWPGKRESRYSPRTSAPDRQAPPPAVAAATPAPVVVAAPAPRDVYAPQPAQPAQAYVYAPAPRYTPPPATVYEQALRSVKQTAAAPVKAPAQAAPAPAAPVKAAAAQPLLQPAPAPAGSATILSTAPIRDQGFAAVPAPAAAKAAPAPVQTAAAPVVAPAPTAAAKALVAPKEPWRTRASSDGPRFYSVHRQFGVAPDPTRVSAAPTAGAATDKLPNDFFIAAGPNPDEAEADAPPEQLQQPIQQPAKKRKQPIRKK